MLFIFNCFTSQAVTFSEAGAKLDPVKSYAPPLRSGGETPTICPFCVSTNLDTSADPIVCIDCKYEIHSSIGGNVPADGGEWFALLLLAGTCGYYHTKTKTLNR